MKQGWIKLHRKLIDSTVFDNPKILKTWIWCLCKASHKEHEVLIGKQIVKLKEGQFIFGRKKASEILNINERTLYDYMMILQSLNMILMQTNNKFTLVTIENWNIYQDDISEIQQQNTQQSTLQSTPQNDTYKNEKNGKKEKKIFIIPSVDEVQAYCRERENHVDAETFISFYESKGWMIGKSKMKDWKAAIRTWERNGMKKGGEKNEQSRTEQRKEYDTFGL